jgi:hypothetical protein
MPKKMSTAAKSGRTVKSRVRSSTAKRTVVRRATGRIRTKRPGSASKALSA